MSSNLRAFPSSPEEEICLTGISGEFPNSKNINEFEFNLYNKIDMVNEVTNRYVSDVQGLPKRNGNIGSLEKFDAQFFGIHFKQAHSMDPQGRMLIEKAYEAILDAGIHPRSIKGTRTGVYVGVSFVEADYTWFYEKTAEDGFGLTGCCRNMLANRISYALDLYGPSVTIDTACSSSLYALDFAFSALRNGECDAAVIGGVNLLMSPIFTLQFLSRPFDANSSGYTRSETVCAIYLQKSRDAKRVYAKLLYSKTSSEGLKTEGITFPSSKAQQRLLTEFYKNINIDPVKVQFVEAHGTGTLVGDPEECDAISQIFCKNRKEPLLVGAMKSNMGHAEAASSMCSLAKIIFACERSEVAPNLHYTTHRKAIKSIEENKIRVCTEITKLVDPLMAVNAFGFGGSIAHALLAQNPKVKINGGAPIDCLPRLINWSGRTQESLDIVFNALTNQPMDVEFIALLHNIQQVDEPGFIHRGYSVLGHCIDANAVCLESNSNIYTDAKQPLIFMYSGMGSQWNGMGKCLMHIPLFRSAIDKCHNVLKPHGVDLQSVITTDEPTIFDISLNSFVGIVAIQIAITDILKELQIFPDYIIGHSFGEIACGYADGALTLEETILAAYYRGFASLAAKHLIPKGMMAVVGKGYNYLTSILPTGVHIACRNSSDSCTISGLEENVRDFVNYLKKLNIFVTEVDSTGIPYHTGLIKEIGKIMSEKLQKIIKSPQRRSLKWVSTSVPKECRGETTHQFASANYYANNLLSPVLFEEGVCELPEKSVMLEIAPHGLLQSIVKKAMPNAIHLATVHRPHPNNLEFFLGILGKLYTNGHTMPIHKLYPAVHFPVSRQTQKISPLIKWQHNENWFVTKYDKDFNSSGERKFKINITSDEFSYLTGHQIDGRVLFPATGYLYLVWQTMAGMKKLIYQEMDVEFEDVRFLRATNLSVNSGLELTVMLHYGSGRFEISEKSTSVATGIIRDVPPETPMTELPPMSQSECSILNGTDFYRELRVRGYQYNGSFQSLAEMRADGLSGKIKWCDNWVSFMDCLLQVNIFGKDTRSLYLPTRIRKLRINAKRHLSSVNSTDSCISVKVCPDLELIQAGGMELTHLSANAVSRRNIVGKMVRSNYTFISQHPTPQLNENDALRVCFQLAFENGLKLKFRALEVHVSGKEPIVNKLDAIRLKIPLIRPTLYLLTDGESDLEMENVTVIRETLAQQKNISFIIASECSNDLGLLAAANSSLVKGGFLLSRETRMYLKDTQIMGFNVISNIQLANENFVLLKKAQSTVDSVPKVIYVNSDDMQFKWLKELKDYDGKGSILLVAEKEQFSGLLGLFNCLRKESKGLSSSIRMVFIADLNAPAFDLNNDFYQQQLRRGCAVNIYLNGNWGSYRFLKLVEENEEIPQKDHCYANVLRRGDLSSLAWLKGPLKMNKNVALVQYASLNFKDVMLTTGKLSPEDLNSSRLNLENLVGFEFSGIDCNGRSIMGISPTGALSTYSKYLENDTYFVPDSMSLEEAATIPVVYLTVYLAFFAQKPISSGKSILIHAGSGGIGLSAIRVALAYDMIVFTTVSNDVKKKFLLEQFPSLKESHIGNSRDCTFERMVKLETKGKGVDFVLNSLSDEKLKASIRCLGSLGTFLEIGKFDIENNSEIGLECFVKQLTFRSILADQFNLLEPFEQNRIRSLIQKDLENGIIKPLPATIFNVNEIEKAFRYLSAGKHVGKVIIQIRTTPFDEHSWPIKALPRCYFNADEVYIILGGLGGFGLELADWMILRGARTMILSSRRGISNGYQEYRIRLWKSYGVEVIVSTDDICTLSGCQAILNEAAKHGKVDGIFNLAAILRDGKLETQTSQNFIECMAPKTEVTKHFDQLSRKEYPNLRYFVVFSSVSCGMGNVGQTNYGMANSVMERIVEKRVLDGLSGKAIQWGAIAEVGLAADITKGRLDAEVVDTMQQPILSCLTELDALLTTSEPIVQCMLTPEERKLTQNMSIVDLVMNILGIQDTKSISVGASLSELGMDSLMATEIMQALEREFDITLPVSELRIMTLLKLKNFSKNGGANVGPKQPDVNVMEAKLFDFKRLIENTHSTEKLFYPLSSKNDSKITYALVMVHGIDGVNELWNKLALQIEMPTYMVNFADHIESVDDFVDSIFMNIMDVFQSKKQFYILAYSFGSIAAMEIARRLEQCDKHGHVIFADGSPKFVQKLVHNFIQTTPNIENLQIQLSSTFIHEIIPTENMELLRHKMSNFNSWSNKLKHVAEVAQQVNYEFSPSIISKCNGLYRRLRAVLQTPWLENVQIKSPITLIRSNTAAVDIDEDYQLSQCTKGEISVKFVGESHQTILENPMLTTILNELDQNL